MAKLTTMNSPLSLLIFSLALRLLFFTREAVAIPLEAQKQREFDYFALALQWPGTFCQRTHHCCSQNGCCRPEPLTWFTIHGLWPDYYDGTWPSCCSRTEFDIKKVSSLLPTLDKYWPTLSCGSTSQCDGSKGSFWGHEWGKHGTCSYPLIQDEYSYFSKALELYFKYNITVSLGEFCRPSLIQLIVECINAVVNQSSVHLGEFVESLDVEPGEFLEVGVQPILAQPHFHNPRLFSNPLW